MHRTSLLLILLLATCSLLFSQDRKIAAGDAIEIVVYGHQELSRTVQVGANGAIDFPFMQNLPVDGLTLERLREIIVAQLSRYLDTYPVVTVNFSTKSTVSVHVAGMVKNPGILQVPVNSSLQGALAAAGGMLPGARAEAVQLRRTEAGRTTESVYDLELFLLEGDLKQNPALQEGDLVLVTGNPLLSTVKVIGAVNKPGAFAEYRGATVLDMLLQAGGPTVKADLGKVRYISPSRKKAVDFKIDLDRYFTAGEAAQLPVVKPGDVIIVPEKGPGLWRNLLTIARDVSTIAIAVWYVVRIND